MRRIVKISLVLAILAVIYLILPFSLGAAAQRSTSTFLQNENNTLGKVFDIRLSLANYKRGWFHSTALLQIEQKTAGEAFTLVKTIPVIIDHGPIYRINGRFLSGLGFVRSADQTDKNAPYQISFRDNIGFQGERGAFIFISKQGTQVLPDGLQINSLVLHMQSNPAATHFAFQLDANGLHYQNPPQMISAGIQHVESNLTADYLGDRHWALNFGVGLKNSQFSAGLSSSDPADTVVFNANTIQLNDMHFDTQKMASLLNEFAQLKEATDTKQSVKPTAWMAFLQQLLTQIINSDTQAQFHGLSVKSPMGQIHGNYTVSFPTLADQHDYFDIATHNVSQMNVTIPHWVYSNTEANTEFSLYGFEYHDIDNTVFSRHSKIIFGSFDMSDIHPSTKTALFSATGFSYESALSGDIRSLNQTMGWQLAKLCFDNNCYSQVQGKLEFLKMNYNGFRGIATATRRVVQYNPQETESLSARWMDLADAYTKLVSPETQVVISHDMETPKGPVKINAQLSWPTFNAAVAAAPVTTTFLNDTHYQANVLFPAAYVDSFLSQPTPPATPAASADGQAKATAPSAEEQAKQFLQYAIAQGYLKKTGDAYTVNLSGIGSAATVNGVPFKAQ